MLFYYINVGLTYFTIGFACAMFFTFIVKKPLLGRFWGALIVGLIGSFLGGLIDHIFADFIAYFTDFNSVNIFTATITAMIMIWFLSKVSASK